MRPRLPPLLALLCVAPACSSDDTQQPDASDLAVNAADLVAAVPDLIATPDLAADNPDLLPPVYHRPPPRAEAAFGYDAVTNRVVFFGGDDGGKVGGTHVPRYHDDTWLYDVGQNAWSRSKAMGGPGAVGRAAFAMDTRKRQLFVHGGRYRPEAAGADGAVGYTLDNGTWIYDVALDAWSAVQNGGPPYPPARSGAVAVYDGSRSRLVTFGGSVATGFRDDPKNSQAIDDTWQLGAGWAKVATQGMLPPKRHLAAAALDTKRNRMVVTGGCCDNAGRPFSDAWALDLGNDTWMQLAVDGAGPSRRFGHGAAYDAMNDQVIVFGGHEDSPVGDVNDVWGLDGDGNWRNLNPGDLPENPLLGCGGDPVGRPFDFVLAIFGSPERRERLLLLSIGDRMLLAGGEGDCAHIDDTWTLEAGTFTRLIPPAQGESCLRRAEMCPCLCR